MHAHLSPLRSGPKCLVRHAHLDYTCVWTPQRGGLRAHSPALQLGPSVSDEPNQHLPCVSKWLRRVFKIAHVGQAMRHVVAEATICLPLCLASALPRHKNKSGMRTTLGMRSSLNIQPNGTIMPYGATATEACGSINLATCTQVAAAVLTRKRCSHCALRARQCGIV